jgi:hypothetical protein
MVNDLMVRMRTPSCGGKGIRSVRACRANHLIHLEVWLFQSHPAPPTLHMVVPLPKETPTLAPGVVHVWSTCHRNRAVRSGLQRYIIRAGGRWDPGETGPGAEP